MNWQYVKIFTYLVALPLILSLMISIIASNFPAQMFDVDSEEFQVNQAAFQEFAGDAAMKYNPFILKDIRGPGYSKIELWPPGVHFFPNGDAVGRDRYGAGSPYGTIGIVNAEGVFLDPAQKSSKRLGNNVLGEWEHTGYRYIFAPSSESDQNQQISIIWYKFGDSQGLDAGIDISFLDKRFDNIPAADIIANYDRDKQIGEYKFSLGDRSVYALVKFDITALQANAGDYYKTWDQGGWSLNIAKKIIADPEDINPGMLDAVLSLLKMNNPNLPGELNLILFMIVTVPSIVAVVLFIREFLKL